MTRGIKLHNPFDIEKNPNIKWQGAVDPGSDDTFVEFISDVMGLRAGFKNLLTQGKEGYNTVTKIITKYAPPVVTSNAAGQPETNDTAAYIRSVCDALQVGTDDVLTVDDYNTLYNLGCAIILHEQGSQPYTKAQIDQALLMAGCNNAPNPSLASRPETHAAVGAGAIGALTVVSQVSNTLTPTISMLQQIQAFAPIAAAIISLALVGYMCYVLYKKHKAGTL